MATTKKATDTTKKAVKKATVSAKSNAENIVDDVKENVTEVANDVTETINENLASAQAIAKKVWFAGLGVVGRSSDEIQTRYNKASDQLQTRIKQSKEDREQFLQDLVSRGEKVQNEAEVMLAEGRSTIEEQIEAARTRVTSIVDVEARLQAVSEKFDSLKNSLKKTA